MFYDGTTLAIWNGYVWFAALNTFFNHVNVWRAPLGTLDFQPFADPNPFDITSMVVHPRFRAFGGRLYVASGSPSVWKAVWLSRESDPIGNVIEVRQGNLTTVGNPPLEVLVTGQLVPPQVPCDAGTYCGDYNDLTQLIKPDDFGPSPRFITAFTRNGVECAFRTPWTSDLHVGSRVFQ